MALCWKTFTGPFFAWTYFRSVVFLYSPIDFVVCCCPWSIFIVMLIFIIILIVIIIAILADTNQQQHHHHQISGISISISIKRIIKRINKTCTVYAKLSSCVLLVCTVVLITHVIVLQCYSVLIYAFAHGIFVGIFSFIVVSALLESTPQVKSFMRLTVWRSSLLPVKKSCRSCRTAPESPW